jgi:hypothetical protein
MKILECFDHAFVLNLPCDIQRMSDTREELKRCNISFERLNGVTVNSSGDFKKCGILGALSAHISAVKIAQERGYISTLIIEDDIILRPNFCDLWADTIPELHRLSYDLFFFYRWTLRPALVRPLGVMQIEKTVCTHFYAVHSKFYQLYINFAENQLKALRPKNIDEIFKAPEVNIWATSYNLAGQRSGQSNVTRSIRQTASFG